MGMGRMMFQMMMMTMAFNMIMNRAKSPAPVITPAQVGDIPNLDVKHGARSPGMRNLYGLNEDCELFVHISTGNRHPNIDAVLDEKLGKEQGIDLVWHQRVWYASDAQQH